MRKKHTEKYIKINVTLVIYLLYCSFIMQSLFNVKCKVVLTEAYLEPSWTLTMEFFSLWLSHILKTYLIRSNCLYVPFFAQLTRSWKNLQLWKLREKKSFVNNRTFSFFFWNSKLHKCQNCLCLYCFLFSRFQILWSKHFFKNNCALFNS